MEAKQELGPNQEKWLQALESGDYKQGMGNLHVVLGYGELFCCLGVGCAVFDLPREQLETVVLYDGVRDYAPEALVKALGLHSSAGSMFFHGTVGGNLAAMNDSGNYPFKVIAATIRNNPAVFFVEPR
jgi:hypothetical protein